MRVAVPIGVKLPTGLPRRHTGRVDCTVIEAVAEAAPVAPLQVSIYEEFAVILLSARVPEVVFSPVHAPEAEQFVVLAELQVRVAEPPEAIEFVLEVMVTLGCELGDADMVMVLEALAEPPVPLQVSV